MTQPKPRLVVWLPELAQAPDLSCLDCAAMSVATRDTIVDVVTEADVILVADFHAHDAEAVWRDARSLQWVHVLSTGVDHILTPALINSSALLTNGRGCFDRSIAEFVLMTILSMAKDLPKCIRAQDRREWESHESGQVDGSHVVVIGPGAIGTEVASLLTAAGMIVEGIGRLARPPVGALKAIHPVRELKNLIGSYDYVVLTAPLTSETRGLIDTEVLQRMKPTARLVNVARGELVNEPALIDALASGTIAGAALDVFAAEPLRPSSPLWAMSNVIITGHMAGDFTGWRQREIELFVENFERFASGRRLLNVVDKALGYVPSERGNRL